MPLDLYVTLIVSWVIPSLVTAAIAARKGRSFAKWLIIGLVFSPGCAILMALILHKRPSKKTFEKYVGMERSELPDG